MADLEFFNLNSGESATVRILSSTVASIERVWVHTVAVGGKNKKFTCIAKNSIDECPLCKAAANGNESVKEATERLIVHLFDYTDGKEKIWNRTVNANFLANLKQIEDAWGGRICDCVITITRKGADFPKYELMVVNANMYPPLNMEMLDQSVGYRASSYRNSEEYEEFLRTGVMPAHKKTEKAYAPKDRFANSNNNGRFVQTNQQVKPAHTFSNTQQGAQYKDPFARG